MNTCAWCGSDRDYDEFDNELICWCPHEDGIFVFGSNLSGIHGAGAARFAMKRYGAVYGVGVGITGRSYAIPTKDHQIQTLSLAEIAVYVDQFVDYAAKNPDESFLVTRIGCGLAGYTDEQIAPMFAAAPVNCLLPPEWKPVIGDENLWFAV